MLRIDFCYPIEYNKNRTASSQLRVLPTCALHDLLKRELDSRTLLKAHGLSKYPFWRHGDELWLEVQMGTNLPQRTDTTHVLFVVEKNKLLCYFKKTQPFRLMHYIEEDKMIAMHRDITLTTNKNVKPSALKHAIMKLTKVSGLKQHPTKSEEGTIAKLLEFYDELQAAEEKK